MKEIAGIPYTTAEFNEKGARISEPTLPDDTRELIIVSHGWNNNRGEAESMYRDLFTNFAKVARDGLNGVAVVGVLWPSKKFDFSVGEAEQAGQAEVRAAAVGGTSAEMQRKVIGASFAEFESVFENSGKDQELAALRALLADIDQPGARREFVEKLRAMVGTSGAHSKLDGSSFFFEVNDPRDVFINAEQASADVQAGVADGNTDDGRAQGLASMVSGAANAVNSLLNITSYYEMKNRAGVVGTLGLAPLIDELATRGNIQHIHLVGHSFGGRLVTAAAMASTTTKLHSLALLQAAFSHNGFSNIGYFRKVIANKRLSGPIIITYSRNDKAVGKAYAIASRVSGDATAGVGDKNDKYGGMGGNGARNMADNEVSPATREMLTAGAPYALQNNIVHNLESSAFIKDHGNVEGKEVAWAISQAIATAK